MQNALINYEKRLKLNPRNRGLIQLGHNNFRTTQIYGKVVQEKISKGYEKVEGKADLTKPYYLSSQMNLVYNKPYYLIKLRVGIRV